MIARIKKLWEWGLLLVLVIMPWQTIWLYDVAVFPGASFAYKGIGMFAVEAIIWGLAILYIALFLLKRPAPAKPVWRKDRLAIMAVSAFTLYALASVLWAPMTSYAHMRALQVFAAVVFAFMLMSSRWQAKQVGAALLFGAVMPTLLGLWQFISQSGFDSTLLGLQAHVVGTPGSSVIQGPEIGRWARAYGPFAHPNVFGGYLAAMSVVALLSISTFSNKLARISVSTLLALMTMALLATFSRSAWVAAAFAMIVFCFLHISRRKKMWSLAGVVIGAVCFMLLYAPLVSFRLVGSSNHQTASITDRVDQYSDAAAVIAAHPVLGTGIGNYEAAVFMMDSNRSAWLYQPVHNFYALVLAELGVIGWVFLLGSVLLSVRMLQVTKENLLLLLALLAPLDIISFFDHYLWTSLSGLLIVAILVVFFQKSTKKEAILA
ncbi:MAG: O-antigen ligase family protein [Candidatus Magasanikbacteria bacterium]|nr:O-antigen ligase family protein [Candidatus Magasanikbacteria bacterium]